MKAAVRIQRAPGGGKRAGFGVRGWAASARGRRIRGRTAPHGLMVTAPPSPQVAECWEWGHPPQPLLCLCPWSSPAPSPRPQSRELGPRGLLASFPLGRQHPQDSRPRRSRALDGPLSPAPTSLPHSRPWSCCRSTRWGAGPSRQEGVPAPPLGGRCSLEVARGKKPLLPVGGGPGSGRRRRRPPPASRLLRAGRQQKQYPGTWARALRHVASQGEPSLQAGWGVSGASPRCPGEALLPAGARPLAHTLGAWGTVSGSVRSKAQGATARTNPGPGRDGPGTSQHPASPGGRTKAGPGLGERRQGPGEREAGGRSGAVRTEADGWRMPRAGGEDGGCGVWRHGGGRGRFSSGASGRN